MIDRIIKIVTDDFLAILIAERIYWKENIKKWL